MIQNSVFPYWHKGEWAIHELLPILLNKIGPAKVMMSTFNVSEDFLRPVFFLIESGKITDIKLLIDSTVKRHKLDLLLFAFNITKNIRITSCHAKVLLIENEQWNIGIVGSANANQNARYEAGFFFTDSTNFNFFKTEIENTWLNDAISFNVE